MTALSRRYLLLMRAYPAHYRAERGEELLGTLLDGARPDQTRPTLAEAADIVGSGLLCRLRFGYVRDLSAGAGIAAVVALAIAGGLGAYCAVVGDPVFAVWPLAAVTAAAYPRRGRVAIAVAVLTGLVWTVVADGNSPLAMATVLSFGLLALLGWRSGAPGRARAALVLGATALATTTYAVGAAYPYGTYAPFPVPGMLDPGDPPFDPWAAALPLLLVLVGLAVVAAVRRGRWGWAALLILVPTGPQAQQALLLTSSDPVSPPWGTPTWLLLGALGLGAAVAIWWAGQHQGRPGGIPGPDQLLGAAAAAALAGAAGLGLAYWGMEALIGVRTTGPVAYAAFLLAALLYPLAGRRLALPATILAIVTAVVLPAFGGPTPGLILLAPLLALGLLATAAMTGTAARPRPVPVAAGAVAVAAIGLLLTRRPEAIEYLEVSTTVTAITALPMAVAAAAAGLSLRQPGRHRRAALVAVWIAAANLSAVAPAYFSSYGLIVLLGGAAILIPLGGLAVRGLRRLRLGS
ncbi:hypothetical protein [Phytohabitans rumicis]|uniref:Uncharacterized protein n=1 Tax=Phytohabitans rumicis TaxID=1076125 RepID=A0A6V8L3C2_9ACTN|nr:hypothetical protein [Phytohabitans rumicis]GFJ88636.1 hypothetical protein Prum_022780 [Phytohabitans rumicis]